MKVLRFGGSSLSSRQGFEVVARTVSALSAAQMRVVVVASALEGVTDMLAEAATLAAKKDGRSEELLAAIEKQHRAIIQEVIAAEQRDLVSTELNSLLAELRRTLRDIFSRQTLSPQATDTVLSFGERFSTLLLTAYLHQHLGQCLAVDARKLIVTDSSFGSARVRLEDSFQNIRSFFSAHDQVCVVTGFIAATTEGETTTLGRGGSDYTAVLLGAALGANEIQFWTTVDGIMTADPARVKRALTIEQLSFEEAMELCHFGAKVLYPPSIQEALEHEIPIRIKNTLRPEFPGSLISVDTPQRAALITGISSISQIALCQLYGSGLIGVTGVARRLFAALSHAQVNVILISQASSEHSICFAVRPEDAEAAEQAVRQEFASEIAAHRMSLDKPSTDFSIVAVVGASMRNSPGISGRLFQALGKNGINVAAIAQGSSELNISAVIARSDEAKALNALHDAFFLSDRKSVHLFLVGTGQVGSTLLEQISAQVERLAEKKLELRLVGISDSKKMLFNEDGVELSSWQVQLQNSAVTADAEKYVQQMKTMNLPNSIFIDCTASEAIAAQYLSVLQGAISIVTPNKRANSGTLAAYEQLREQARRANVKYFYETNVGAGLPVIGTLGDLLASGDELVRIEAVLSGTLSYLFNTYDGSRPFSEIVREAKRKGYTEPDPRDDLSGKDVGRKLLILAREIGLPFEEEDIEVSSLIPNNCRAAGSVDEFLDLLAEADAEFETKRRNALEQGKVLRYIGRIETGKAAVSLDSVGPEHPFYSLSGSDNVISFVTKRYFDRPLVVKGPGAGTDVTAAGVLADVLRVASYLG